MDDDVVNKAWKDWTESGINEKTVAILDNEDIATLGDFVITTDEDRAELKKAGISMGQFNRLKELAARHTQVWQAVPTVTMADTMNVAGHASGTQMQGRVCMDGSADRSADRPAAILNHEATSGQATTGPETLKTMLGQAEEGPHSGNVENLMKHLNIKDVRNHPELDDAGKLWEHLLNTQNGDGSRDPLLLPPLSCQAIDKNMRPGDTATVKTNNSKFSHDDPRAILIMRATNNKTIHITSFLSEETKKRLRNKRQQYLVQQGENLTMKIRDEHPYAGISTLEYGAANMRLLNYLINNDILPREKI